MCRNESKEPRYRLCRAANFETFRGGGREEKEKREREIRPRTSRNNTQCTQARGRCEEREKKKEKKQGKRKERTKQISPSRVLWYRGYFCASVCRFCFSVSLSRRGPAALLASRSRVWFTVAFIKISAWGGRPLPNRRRPRLTQAAPAGPCRPTCIVLYRFGGWRARGLSSSALRASAVIWAPRRL